MMNISKDDDKIVTFLDVIPSISHGKVVSYIVKKANNDLMFYSNSDSRQKIASEIGISEIRVKQLISELVKSGILIKLSRGVYTISKKYVTVGQQ